MFTDTLQISVETVQRISSSKENVGNGKANQLLLPERVWNKYYECGGWGGLERLISESNVTHSSQGAKT